MTHHYTAYKPDLGDPTLFALRFSHYENGDALAAHIKKYASSLLCLDIHPQYIIAQFSIVPNNHGRLQVVKEVSSVEKANNGTWMEIVNPPLENRTYAVDVGFNTLTKFHFDDYLSVGLDPEFIWNDDFNMTLHTSNISMTCLDFRFSIRPIDIDGPILISETNNSFEIFFCLKNPPCYYVNNKRAHMNFNNRAFNFRLERKSALDATTSWKIRNGLKYYTKDVYFVSNLNYHNMDHTEPITGGAKTFAKSLVIEAWRSQYAAILPPVLPNKLMSRLFFCSSITQLQVLLNSTVPLRFQETKILQIPQPELEFPSFDPPQNFTMLGRVNITPSRFILMPRRPVRINRVFRFFPDQENFLLVSFVDEHKENPWRSENIYEWFLNVLENGFTVGGKSFKFLGCSNSQLRDGHCWFSCLDRQVVYDKIGKMPEDWSAGRKLSRLALAFASSIETVTLNHERYLKQVAPDIETNGVCFSDGIGRGSVKLFQKLREILNLSQFISAFQVRVGGIKGVISIYDQEEDVMFRKSMKKFESDHDKLEVLNYSEPFQLFLNRHVVFLLSSYGVPDEVFLSLQYNTIADCIEALTDGKKSFQFVKSNSKVFDWDAFPEHQIVLEPMFRQMMISTAIEFFSNIVNHANIHVKEGRVLIGVLDETNTLNYGEVYAHIVEANFEIELCGKVLVYRNPCVLSTDIRILYCRTDNLPKGFKEKYVNVLVFPAKGQDSHANECAGGDLDGDLYYIIWDRSLMPVGMQSKPVTIPGKETFPMNPSPTGNSDHDMMKFFCDYVSKNQLGKIANAHLATMDKFGINHKKTAELAGYIVTETDAPKKGLTVGPISENLMPKEYPDFMGKNDKPTYRSETILGKLYRQATPFLVGLSDRMETSPPIGSLDSIGNDYNIESYYTVYSAEITMILQNFNLKSEVDLFSGAPGWQTYMSKYKQQTKLLDDLMANVKDFWRKWESRFQEWLQKISNDQTQIREWYQRPKCCPHPAHSFSLLALPYVDLNLIENKSILGSIQTSTMNWIFSNRRAWSAEFSLRLNTCNVVKQTLRGVDCQFFGCSVLGLSETGSEVLVYTAENSLEQLMMKLKVLDRNASVMTEPHPHVKLRYHSFSINISSCINGVLVTRALSEAFDKHPGMWPAFRVLLEWARNVRIVEVGEAEGIMSVAMFSHMFLYFATTWRSPSTTMPNTWNRINGWIDGLADSPCNTYIFNFLKFISHQNNKAEIARMKDPITGNLLLGHQVILDELRRNAECAVCLLVVHDGDLQKLFKFSSRTRLFKVPKLFMNPTSSEDQQMQCMIEIKAKCNPKKKRDLRFDLIPHNELFYLEVNGDSTLFSDVEHGLAIIRQRLETYAR